MDISQLTPSQLAKALGALGGARNTKAQQEARSKPKPGAGRPKGSKNKKPAKAKRGRA